MTTEKTLDSVTAEILHELAGLGPSDLARLLKSWKATVAANRSNGDWNGSHLILLQ